MSPCRLLNSFFIKGGLTLIKIAAFLFIFNFRMKTPGQILISNFATAKLSVEEQILVMEALKDGETSVQEAYEELRQMAQRDII